MKKLSSFVAGVCIYVEPGKKSYSTKDSLIVLNERFWIKKAFSLGEGVCIYVEPEKKSYSTKDPFKNF